MQELIEGLRGVDVIANDFEELGCGGMDEEGPRNRIKTWQLLDGEEYEPECWEYETATERDPFTQMASRKVWNQTEQM